MPSLAGPAIGSIDRLALRRDLDVPDQPAVSVKHFVGVIDLRENSTSERGLSARGQKVMERE
jgi:hypothetical protein